jgi:hypothetical protein
MIGNTDQNNQVQTVLWRQYLFYDLFNNIEILLYQNYIYYLLKIYYHVWKIITAYMICTRLIVSKSYKYVVLNKIKVYWGPFFIILYSFHCSPSLKAIWCGQIFKARFYWTYINTQYCNYPANGWSKLMGYKNSADFIGYVMWVYPTLCELGTRCYRDVFRKQ